MRALGNYLLRSRLHGILVISFLTLLSQLFSPLAYMMSGAPLALVGLRKGGATGIQVMLGCILLLLLLGSLMRLPLVLLSIFAMSVWLPVLLCSTVLRTTQAQGRMMLSAGIVGLAFLLYLHANLGRVIDWWQSVFTELQGAAVDVEVALQLQEIHALTEPLLSAMFVAAFLLNLLLTMLFARWWQSLLFNPGGFREEFYRLRLPKVLAYCTLLLTGLLLVQPGPPPLLLRDVMLVLLLLYGFQGLSALHRFVHLKGLSTGWLVACYCLLLFPQMLLVLACFGLADTWLSKSGAYGNNNGDQP